MNSQKWSLPLEELVKVIEATSITPLPLVHDAVEGVLLDGGEVIPVINQRDPDKKDDKPNPVQPYYTVLIARTEEGNVGINIESIVGVTSDSEAEIADDENINTMNLTEFLRKTLGE